MQHDPYRALLPAAYGTLLDADDEGLEPEVIAFRLGVEVDALGPLREMAAAKLRRLRHQTRPDVLADEHDDQLDHEPTNQNGPHR